MSKTRLFQPVKLTQSERNRIAPEFRVGNAVEGTEFCPCGAELYHGDCPACDPRPEDDFEDDD